MRKVTIKVDQRTEMEGFTPCLTLIILDIGTQVHALKNNVDPDLMSYKAAVHHWMHCLLR